MNIEPVAYFHSPLKEKFGIPRQAGLVPELVGKVVLAPGYAREEALRGLEEFDYIWLVWGFSMNGQGKSLTVRPPRLGGNTRVGVFASRSPFRPNGLGLSSVRVESVDPVACTITVSGADLADGTPIYDIKPYVEYADSHPGVRSGFVDSNEWTALEVSVPEELESLLPADEMLALKGVLSQDPRPQYHDNPLKEYGLAFGAWNVRFKVEEGVVSVLSISRQ